MIPIGTEIRFKATIIQEANEDSPRLLMCNRGELGVIIKYDPQPNWDYIVRSYSYPKATFRCSSEEFEVIE